MVSLLESSQTYNVPPIWQGKPEEAQPALYQVLNQPVDNTELSQTNKYMKQPSPYYEVGDFFFTICYFEFFIVIDT